ncbi:polysaccharide pyruvyl transferase family protein [Acetobacter estunensis]|uniref:polysaccharide pyruvyl transferase family protein n=1 Tax=Acetobacter estunensis TaxID=104097 RepID=UPI001C2DCE06|nr:polysaccharide pyruvyl transferase family protein [Acetobacter estunensis]MBV1836448.1 polysaccharide pyruvyl transferase family protein [Acetobacter estunensis]
MTYPSDDVRTTVRDEIKGNKTLVEGLREFASLGAGFYAGYGNLGDALIALGTLDLFRDLGCDFPRIKGREQATLSGYTHVVMGGGGGWVKGLWETYLDLTLSFLREGGRLIILPSTFSSFGSEFVPYADQITMFCREEESYRQLITQGMPEDRVFLCHDLAFYCDPAHFSGLDMSERYPDIGIFRNDEERLLKNRDRASVDLSLLINDIQWMDEAQCAEPLRAVAGLIGQFDHVHTDRLHMAVLSTLLGRTVDVRPGIYFKNRAVFDYTLHRFPNVTFQEEETDYTPSEQGLRFSNQLLRETVRRLNAEQQAEREHTGSILRRNDALLKRNDALLKRVETLQVELEREKQTVRVDEQKEAHIHALSAVVEEMRSSWFHQLSKRYYALFRIPVLGKVLHGLRGMMGRKHP